MERLGAGLLILVLALPVAAIEDPAGDVGATVGGAPLDVPYMDILNVTAQAAVTELHLRMEIAGPAKDLGPGLELNYIFIVDLDGSEGDPVYGNHDLTVLCSRNTTSGAFGCRDSGDGFPVTAAGFTDRNVTATVGLDAFDDEVAIAGATSRVEQGQVTAQDFTDNALPYSSRPAPEEILGQAPVPAKREPRNWVGIGTVSAVVAGGLLYLSRNLWKR